MKHVPESMSDKLPASIVSQLQMAMASLESGLLTKDPDMPRHLQESHRLLISYPETVHLLDDEEIAQLIKAAELHTNTVIVKDAAKGKASSKALSRLSSTDL